MRRRISSTVRAIAAGVPVALAGSVALAAPAAPAHAAESIIHAGAERGHEHLRAAAAEATATVAAGDTVTAIAARHGLRTADVLAWNSLGWSSIIHPGQVLRLTPPTAAAEPSTAPPVASASSYEVVAGDTMSAIAERHGLSTDQLLGANALTRASIIYPGETITIPTADAGSGAAADAVSDPASGPAVTLDAEQRQNAQIVIRAGRSLGVSDRGIAIALATAMQESSLRNLDHGPDDSLGLFQQRPSMGWGTPAEAMDPDRAARAFFGGADDPNGSRTRGLLDVAGWEGLGFAQSAQTVQVSAYPDLYAAWEQSAYAWLAALG